ncbi:hypothetical protein CHS0354_035855 [Potamilus streckersoni]|uniref:G-protein coupled receptors family 3 profile domain-containing protein n=1 Tax=Potamilus streckersoni TaxID=2493646 RepID=A0AAE0SXJ0_9BIVA|nr:hypothetical protein CHS0354_035855 [Potamilus streckersoni]
MLSSFEYRTRAKVEGAVTVQPLAYEVRGFKDYFLSLRPDTNLRNPWFVEYWEQQFHCKYPGARWTPFNQDYKMACTGFEKIEPESFHMEAQLQFVSDALMAFAHALHNMIRDICGQSGRLCPESDPIDGEVLKNYLLHVNFTGLSDQPFSFLPNGDGPPRYRILNFRQKSRGIYSWDTVGFFNNGHLINMSDLQFRLDEPSHPPSVCSLPCGPGEVKNFLPGTNCCWTCYKCHKYQYLSTEFECEDCPLGSLPSKDKHYCVEIPITYLRYDDGMAIGGIVFAVIGITTTAYVSIVFIRYRETPVVKASGRELSFVLLAGIFLCFTMTFALVMKPNMISCGVQKFGIGLSFSICYSAILTKTNRIARIFRSGKRTTQRPKFISPKSQLVICGVIVSVQNVIGIIWLIMRPPKAVPYFSDRDDHQLVCADAVGVYYMVGFSYPILLVIICTIYAILTRKIPEAFNESKYIGFTMYTTCIIWLAFVPIYFSTASNLQLRIATMSYSVSLSATVVLICMFTPKLYIILLHPDKNIRQSIMASKNPSHATYPHAPNNVPCNYSSIGTDHGRKGNEVELAHGQTPESYSSGLSKCTILSAQTNGQSISSQTLNSVDTLADNRDIAL